MNNLRIAWMFPDILYLHGERGNLLALNRFANLRGIETQIERIGLDNNNFIPTDYDIIFFPPGEFSAFKKILSWLREYKIALSEYMKEGRVMLVTGNSVSMFGSIIHRADGTDIEGLNLLNMEYIENESIYGDDLYFEAIYNNKAFEIIGTQIQMGNAYINAKESFGKVKYGYGNNLDEEFEGININNSIFTHTLGPLLINNPWLTDEIIDVACEMASIEITSQKKYDYKLEKDSLEAKKKFILNKATKLKTKSLKKDYILKNMDD